MKLGILAGIIFVIALIMIATIGAGLSHEAQAVLVGAVCGVSASIPIIVGLVAISSKKFVEEPTGSLSQRSYAVKTNSRTTRGDEHRQLGTGGRIIEGHYKISGGKSCKTR